MNLLWNIRMYVYLAIMSFSFCANKWINEFSLFDFAQRWCRYSNKKPPVHSVHIDFLKADLARLWIFGEIGKYIYERVEGEGVGGREATR